MQTVTTHQEMRVVVVAVLDETLLLKDDGEKTIENIVKTYNQQVGVLQGAQDHPELELNFSSMDLREENDSDPEALPAGIKSDDAPNPADSSAGGLTLSCKDVEMSAEHGEPLPQQPRLMMEEHFIKIRGIGAFHWGIGQPFCLWAYPE